MARAYVLWIQEIAMILSILLLQTLSQSVQAQDHTPGKNTLRLEKPSKIQGKPKKPAKERRRHGVDLRDKKVKAAPAVSDVKKVAPAE